MKKLTIAKIEDWIGYSKLPPFLKDGFVISVILHIFFLVLIMVSPYIRIHTNTMPMIKYDEPIIVDLDNLVIDKKTNIIATEKPAPIKVEEKKTTPAPTAPKEEKPDNAPKKSEDFFTPEVAKKDKVEPPPETKEEKKKAKDNAGDFIDTEKKPEEKKEEKKPEKTDLTAERMGGLDDLLASVDGMKRTKDNVQKKEITEIQKTVEKDNVEKTKTEEKTVEIKKGIETADIGNINVNKTVASEFMKKTMAISYIDAIRVKLRSCWHLDVGAKGVKDMKIVIQTSLSPDGNVNNIEILNQDEYASSPWFKAVADSARRALIVCSPYNLPVEFYKEWKDIVFTFYPDKKSVQ